MGWESGRMSYLTEIQKKGGKGVSWRVRDLPSLDDAMLSVRSKPHASYSSHREGKEESKVRTT